MNIELERDIRIVVNHVADIPMPPQAHISIITNMPQRIIEAALRVQAALDHG